LNQGPFPPTGITRLPWYYGPLRHPDRPSLSLAGVQLGVTRPHPTGLPVLRPVPMYMHADATTPVGPLAADAHRHQGRRPSPLFRRVGSHITLFEACSAFTHVPACMLAKPPLAALYIRGFGSLVTSTTAPIATGWSDQLPGGTCTH
jgi:hypothetical protein